jgi:putative redox protein
MEVRIRRAAGKQSEAFARFHRLVSDQPFADGGSDYGMTPPELMLSALGCSVMHCASEYLHSRYLGLDNVEVRVTGTTTGQPPRLVDIGIEVDAPGLNAVRREGLLRALYLCPLYQTLLNPPRVDMGLGSTDPANIGA